MACFKSSDQEIIVKNMTKEKYLKLSHPSFSRRIDYVRKMLLEAMRLNKNQVAELDEEYQDAEYLDNPGLKTQGRLLKGTNEQAVKEKQREEINAKFTPKNVLTKVLNKENIPKKKDRAVYDRFAKIKLGNRMTDMMASKFATIKDEDDY